MYVVLFLPRVWKAFYNTYCGGGRPATGQDCVRLILNSTLSMMVTKFNAQQSFAATLEAPASATVSPDHASYLFRFSFEKCQLKLRNGDRLESMELVFAVDHHSSTEHATITQFQFLNSRILSCVINNELKVSEPAYILGALTIHLTASIHTKVHATSEAVIAYIEQHEKVKLYLAPSMVHTGTLHSSLISSPWSPIADHKWLGGWLFDHPVTLQSVLVDEGLKWMDFRHDGLMHVRAVSPTIDFLWKARRICLKYTTRSRTLTSPTISHSPNSQDVVNDRISFRPLLPLEIAECFFLSSVVHAVDHYLVGKCTENIQYPPINDAIPLNQWENFVCANFRYPLKPNLMRYMDPESVYGEIYNELKLVNDELANVVTCSIMY